jgi:lipoyl(octanoyl) transferase
MVEVKYIDLGKISYAEALAVQQKYFDQLVQNKIQGISNDKLNKLLLCEHFPVITLGKSADEKNVLFANEQLELNGIELFHIGRGGDATFHGPGQITGYPILDLECFTSDLKHYMRQLEEVVIRTIADYGINGYRMEQFTGVWVDSILDKKQKKIAAFGVKTSRWISMHGFALNVNTDLSYFAYINPCGITDKGVTSLQAELQEQVDMEQVKSRLHQHFIDVFLGEQ